MPRRLRSRSAIAALALLIAGALDPEAQDSAPKAARVGQPAPDFTLEDLDGRRFRLSDLRADAKAGREGQVVVLAWWSATGPAVAKTDPILRALHERYRSAGVRFLAVAPFASREDGRPGTESLTLIREFKRLRKIEFPLLPDFDRRVCRQYGVDHVPEVMVIDRSGILRYRGAIVTPFIRPGERSYEPYLENALEAVLAGRMVLRKETRPWGNAIPD
jgi:peroxiredoxin